MDSREAMWKVWEDLLSEKDKAVIRQAGYADQGAASWDSRAIGERPALVVIDMQEFLIGPDLPILQAIERYRTAMGANAWQALAHIQRLVATARNNHLPIIFTRVLPVGSRPTDPVVQIINPLVIESGHHIIDKTGSSAFFGTGLLQLLENAGIDTVIIAGNSTSGCVRATAVDARQHGLNPVVPVECVFDRISASHKIALLDLWMKYALVQPLADVLQYIETCGDRVLTDRV